MIAGADTAPSPSPGLSGSLGVGAIVFMVVAAAAPLSVIAGSVPLGIGTGNGPAFPAMFVLCAGVLLLFAVGFCAMSAQVPDAGAFFTYVRHGLGGPPGIAAAFLALATYTAVQAAVYGYLGAAVGELVTSYGGPVVPWWLATAAVMAAVAVLGYRHVELSSRVLGVLLVAEIAIVLVLDVAVAATGGAAGPSTAMFDPARIASGSVGVAVMFAITAFIGFEATAVFRDEARDPDRTVPRATYVALAVVGLFYAFSAWALVTAWGDEGVVARAAAAPTTLLVDTVTDRLGAFAGRLTAVLLVTSLVAAILSFHHVAARYWYALAAHGALPARCARTHPRHGSPHVASLAQSALSVGLLVVFVVAGLDPVTQVFAWAAGTATLGVLVLMALTCVAVLVFFARPGAPGRLWHTRLAPALGLVGLLVCLALTVANFPTLIGGSFALAVGIGVLLAAIALAGAVVGVVGGRAARSPGGAPGPAN